MGFRKPSIHLASAMFAVLVLFISCSGLSGTVVAPGTAGKVETGADYTDSTSLWGFWQVEIDPITEEINVVPLRGAEFACNVIKFVNGPPSNLIINVISAIPYPNHKDFILDVGLSHPFPGLDRYTGFDVMGVFMGNGTAIYPGDGGYPVAGDSDQQLMNPDGYTRRFNAPEFLDAGLIMPLQGYYPGNNGPPGYVPTAVLNPYKYYADDLEPTGDPLAFLQANPAGRGAFRPGSVNYRRFHVRFPNQTGQQFQYAVIANWDVNDNHPDPPGSLDDFPISCNSQEAVLIDIVDLSDAYYVNETNYGGNVILDITPWDWSASAVSGMVEEYEIRAHSSAWSGAYEFDMTPAASGDHWHTFHAEIPVEMLASAGSLPIWIEIVYPDYDYKSPIGVPNDATGNLTSYFLTEAEITGDQTSGWARTWGSTDDDLGTDIVVDGSGNIYVVGYFRGNVDFDPGEGESFRQSNGEIDVFLSRFDSSGNFQWVRTWGGSLYDQAQGVDADSYGNVYIAGDFWGAVDFDPGPGTDQHTSSGANDPFLCKYDSLGNFLWAITWGGANSVHGMGIAVDSSDNAWVTGHFLDTMDLDPGPGDIIRTSNGSNDIFVCGFDPTGELQWGETWGGSSVDLGMGIGIDTSNNVIFTGVYSDSIDFDPGPGTDLHVSNGFEDIFVCKLDSTGNFIWAGTWGGSNDDFGYALAVDTSGNVYVTGTFSETVDFDPGPGEYNCSSSSSEYEEAFVNALDPDGNFRWAGTWGGNLWDVGTAITTDAWGNVLVTGSFASTVDFDPGPATDNRVSNGDQDVYISKFDSSGIFLWVSTWGASAFDRAEGVCANDEGSIYMTGEFKSSVDFDPGAGIDQHESHGGYDVFLCRLLENGYW